MVGVQGQGQAEIFQGLIGEPGVHADDGLLVLVLGIAFALGGLPLLGRRARGRNRGDHQKSGEFVFHANLDAIGTSPSL